MDTVKFIEERRRMCNYCHGCNACPGKEGVELCVFSISSGISAKEQVAIVEKWSAEHPRKTRQSVFLEQYPYAPLDNNGILQIRPCYIDKNFIYSKGANYCNTPCEICRRDYWSDEVE